LRKQERLKINFREIFRAFDFRLLQQYLPNGDFRSLLNPAGSKIGGQVSAAGF
jgi:hypothetical protein